MDVSEYFAAVNAQQGALDKKFPEKYCWVTSTDKYASVCQVSNRIAATGIVDMKQRLSTDSEVTKFQEHCEMNKTKMATAFFNRRKTDSSGVTILTK